MLRFAELILWSEELGEILPVYVMPVLSRVSRCRDQRERGYEPAFQRVVAAVVSVHHCWMVPFWVAAQMLSMPSLRAVHSIAWLLAYSIEGVFETYDHLPL